MAAINPPTTDDQPPAQPEYAEPVEGEQEAPTEPVGGGEPPAPDATLPPLSDPDGDLEQLEDRSAPVERVLWAVTTDGRRVERVYVQKGLMWFAKLELYGILGQAVEVVLQGDNPLGLDSMLGLVRNPAQMISEMIGNVPGADDAPDRPDDAEQMEIEAGKLFAAFAKVVALAPGLLKEAYCIALGVPKGHKPWAIEWALPNIDDEMGRDILDTFIDQNWGVMEDFFAHELPKIIKRIAKARRKAASAGPR
jgi:hypothetical protein